MTTFSEHLEVLPAEQARLWPRLRELPRHFVLYGGTALALRLGHRASEDFDFFTSEPIESEGLLSTVALLRGARPIQQAPNTLSVRLADFNDIKLSFFGGLTLRRVGEPQWDQNKIIAIASLPDLAGVKLAVIYQRAEAKDYLDVAAILKRGTELPVALGYAAAIYGERFNPVASLKALTYFEDGDLPSLPASVRELLSRAAANVTSMAPTATSDSFVTPRQFRSHQ